MYIVHKPPNYFRIFSRKIVSWFTCRGTSIRDQYLFCICKYLPKQTADKKKLPLWKIFIMYLCKNKYIYQNQHPFLFRLLSKMALFTTGDWSSFNLVRKPNQLSMLYKDKHYKIIQSGFNFASLGYIPSIFTWLS